ncbi:hypothetical protein [Aquibium sp. ELW1220]|uniref:hypothetical protein n=1 Tax=Aquibium sp. ELW1220 TaxID=2976766 RepID=UPI0025B15BCE|nr:hypothetical protein [Aquibium sp. ELW1220]MDN2578462.1 hypothetical protein [Aquibium sp. ELW1220]
MQIIDIRITPAAEAEDMSRVRFIGEGGDEVAVTIANHHNGGATIEQELVAKAKVMLLHAAAAQMKDKTTVTPEIIPSDVPDEGAEVSGLQSLEEEQDNPFQNPDEALPSDEAETAIDEDMEQSRGRFGD